MSLRLEILPGRFAVCRLPAEIPDPAWARSGELSSITRTAGETSVVCAEGVVPEDVRREAGWRALRVEGILDFSLTGILSSILDPLAGAQVSIFALSTFDTDYVLVRDADLDRCRRALADAGHEVLLTAAAAHPVPTER